MISIEEARARILSGLVPLPAETVPLADAWNRVLAIQVQARLTQPPADVSAMDGYAVRASASGALRVIGAAPAGHPYTGAVEPGEAVRIFTGSVVPSGADSVVLQEDVTRDGDAVHLAVPAIQGAHIRRAGQDFHAGDAVLAAGTQLGARQIGLAAASNHPFLAVHRRPVAAILATGDEIVLPGEPAGPGAIVSSNSFMLAALVRAAGGLPCILPVTRDDPAAIANATRAAAARADLLITTGGASVGDHDAVKQGLAEAGVTLDFWKIAMRPGKPMLAGRLNATPVLGLPGNPVSAFVCAILFAWPALRRLAGSSVVLPPILRARAGAPLRANDHRADHLRASLAQDDADGWVATPHPRQDSGMLSVLSAANALILRAPNAPAVEAGADISAIPLNEFGL